MRSAVYDNEQTPNRSLEEKQTDALLLSSSLSSSGQVQGEEAYYSLDRKQLQKRDTAFYNSFRDEELKAIISRLRRYEAILPCSDASEFLAVINRLEAVILPNAILERTESGEADQQVLPDVPASWLPLLQKGGWVRRILPKKSYMSRRKRSHRRRCFLWMSHDFSLLYVATEEQEAERFHTDGRPPVVMTQSSGVSEVSVDGITLLESDSNEAHWETEEKFVPQNSFKTMDMEIMNPNSEVSVIELVNVLRVNFGPSCGTAKLQSQFVPPHRSPDYLCFSIITPQQVFHFECSSVDDVRRWILGLGNLLPYKPDRIPITPKEFDRLISSYQQELTVKNQEKLIKTRQRQTSWWKMSAAKAVETPSRHGNALLDGECNIISESTDTSGQEKSLGTYFSSPFRSKK